jgi:EAL domain-containing protein (putative c-di-GMP-specific phosphodiesterase class I)/ABC-type amino acid transport substrate-binding protein/GGDEF domain-containing protein
MDSLPAGHRAPLLLDVLYRSCGAVFLFLACSAAGAEVPDKVVFGGDAAYPPFEWLHEGEAVGFNVELAHAVGEAGNTAIEYRLGDWPDVMQALEDGEIDVVPMFRSIEREERLLFTSAFYYTYHAIYSRSGTEPIYAVEELAGHTVAVEESSYAHQKLTSEGIQLELALRRDTLEALQALVDGTASYALLAAPASDELIRMHGFQIERTNAPIWPREYAFAVRKDRTDLAQWLRQNLALAVSTGQYERIYRHWERRLEAEDSGLTVALRNAAIVIVPLVFLIALSAGWVWTLRRTVDSRTHELRAELVRRQAAEEHLSYLADHDLHTGLPEPHHFIRAVDTLLRNADRQSQARKEVLALKLVELEKVSRTLGYDVGNEFVREFAELVHRAGFLACAHLGRGVFAVFCDRKSWQRYLAILSGQLDVGDLKLYPHLIGGAAHWPRHGTTATSLLRRAEIALTVSASRMRQWTTYHSSMEPDERDLRIVTDFRRIRARGLHAVYQPQVDLRTGRIIAAEALVRWQHPELGMIPPAQFVPLIESAGLIGKVTTLMLKEAIRVSTRLRRSGQPCPISVNVATYDLIATDIRKTITNAMKRHEAEPGDLKLELTETSVAEDPERVRKTMEQLRECGIAISIDDFGTGHSSLSYLSTFPINEIKIDRSFVNGMLASRRHRSIVRSTILMAHELGMSTVAEGAENHETLQALRSDNCDRVQGYVISRPLPEKDFLEFLAAHANSSALQDPGSP